MDARMLPLVLGGFLPALFYGIAGVIQKASGRAGGSASLYLIGFGCGTLLAGVIYRQLSSDPPFAARPLALALIAGISFAAGAGLISAVLIRFDASVAQLAPLYNMNTLITVVLGLTLYAEWANLSVPRLLVGTVAILLGGWLVSSA